MFKKFTKGCVTIVQKYLPDPFLFAVILNFIVFILGMVVTGQGPKDMVLHWGNGFWNLLAFSMQMVLVLVTGHALANAPIIKRFLANLAKIAKTPSQAILAVTFISIIACWINWGFGLVIGALYARQLAKRVKNVDYRLLIASAYSGFVVWHAGISGSIPLKLATAGADLAKATNNAVTEPVSTSLTIFSPFNLIISGIILITMPLLNKAMHPSEDEAIAVDPELLEDENLEPNIENPTPADKMENSPVLSILIGIMGIAFAVFYFAKNGFALNLNIVNFLFLFAGIILHGTPKRYIGAVAEATKGASGIILQFPFYAGIMGMMVGVNPETGSSFAGVISEGFVNISTPTTFPLFTFLSAGIVNFFVPSGGGQWAVQAPIMMPAGNALGVSTAKTGMSIAWGDAWTNMIQPFWALPALGIAGLGARDIMGFCVIDLIYTGIIIALGLMFL
ncbi:short-chain fatty acid transporter [Clostridiisalibacter paucivorans]|uniref:short-chain fatty acid transporter n=1 Tax=Clostridiisalibacter paucivorans TaxID=408753 RepID=UPI000478EE27|nr:short-chain fatty acid transporter [Clostridiisalibacter paucivorans]